MITIQVDDYDFDVSIDPNYTGVIGAGTAARPGIIDEFGAAFATFPTSPTGIPNPGRIATLFFNAVAPGVANVVGGPADTFPAHDTLLLDEDDPVDVSRIRYDSLQIVVGAGGGSIDALQNAALPQDVNADGTVSTIDALLIIKNMFVFESGTVLNLFSNKVDMAISLSAIAVLGVVGISLARQEARSQVRATSRDMAFYAAEAGLARGLRKWTVPDTLIPAGTYWQLDAGTLPGGASYRTGVTKLGDGSSIHSLFAVRTEGIARDGSIQHAGLLVHTRPLENPFKAALEVLDSTYLAGTADIIGFDIVPSIWNGPYCSALDEDMAGVIMTDTLKYERKGAAKVKGSPPLKEDTDTVGFFDLGDITFDELAADADFVLPLCEATHADVIRASRNTSVICQC